MKTILKLLSKLFKKVKTMKRSNAEPITLIPKGDKYIPMKWKLNLQPSPYDKRDYKYEPKLRASMLPTKATIKEFDTSVCNQYTLGSCAAFAGVAALENLKNQPGEKYRAEKIDLSELFLYYEGRVNKESDSGCYIRDIMKALQKVGVPLEEYCPYNIPDYKNQPSNIAYFCARYFRITNYYKCWSLSAIKDAIANFYPVEIGVYCDSNIYKTIPLQGKRFINLPKGEAFMGHAMEAVSYDDELVCPDGSIGALEVKNSWSTNFGDMGYAWIPYNSFIPNMLESWAIDVR